jgi:DNA ligase (NAD+)
MGRTGILTPVAILDPIEIDGTTVERASLHNLSQIENLNLGGTGSIVKVQKSNQII